MKYQDYYDTLGVARGASQADIQRAYRKLARQFHPDVNKGKGAEEKFKLINEAHEVLGDAEKRKRYDALGANWKAGQEFRPPPGFENVRFHFGGRGQGAAPGGPAGQAAGGATGAFGFSDFFEAIFGGGFGPDIFGGGAFGSGPFSGGQGHTEPGGGPFSEAQGYRYSGGSPFGEEAAGQSHHAEIELALEDVYNGAAKTISLETLETDARGQTSRKVKSYQVKIPPGTGEGSAIRLAGQGGSGLGGGQPGDLLLRVKMIPHPRFKLSGYDMTQLLAISPWEAALGAKLTVPLIGEEVKLTIPPGSQSGSRLRLKGKGLPITRSKRGDLYVELQIALPEKLSSEERELFEKLAQVSKFKPRR